MDTASSSSSPAPLATKRKRDAASAEELEIDIDAPEPPSKRAQRLAKKGKIVPPRPTSPSRPPIRDRKHASEDDDDAGINGNGAATKSTVQEPTHGIWIGNLNWTTDKTALRSFLMERGNISESSIKRIHMPTPSKSSANNLRRPKPAKNKGFAYVDFSTIDAQKQALGLSETLIDGRKLLIKDSASFEGRPAEHVSNAAGGNDAEMIMKSTNPPNKRVFVGNLHFETDRDGLQEHFEKCGKIDQAFVATFEDSGKCKGYAWITFADLEGAKNAVRGWLRRQKPPSADESGDNRDGLRRRKEKKVWVNVLANQRLRVEFAEDSNARYQKRFGKGRDKQDHGSDERSAEKAG